MLLCIIGAFSFFTWINSCNNSSNTKALRKIESRLDSLATPAQVKQINEQTSYKFLIYENDLDNKRTSLSEIENKLSK